MQSRGKMLTCVSVVRDQVETRSHSPLRDSCNPPWMSWPQKWGMAQTQKSKKKKNTLPISGMLTGQKKKKKSKPVPYVSESSRTWIYHYTNSGDNKNPHLPFSLFLDHYHDAVLISASFASQRQRSINDPQTLTLPPRALTQGRNKDGVKCWYISRIVIPLLF